MMVPGQDDAEQDIHWGGWPGSLWAAQPGHFMAPVGKRMESVLVVENPADVQSLFSRGNSFPGLSRHLKHTLRIATVAVVFAVVSAWGLIIPVCQSEKLRISVLWGAGPPFPCLVGESKEHC